MAGHLRTAEARDRGFGGFGIVMTDIFVAATAALLLTLAVARPEPPVSRPVQADLVVLCPRVEQGDFVLLAADTAKKARPPMVAVTNPADLARAVEKLGLPPRMFYTIALAASPARPMQAECLRTFQRKIVDKHNQGVTRPGALSDGRMIFGLAPVDVVLDLED